MKKISRKKHLEMLIQSIPSHPNPDVNLEQYSTPSVIASDLLWNALSLGDISNKNILDLGCGTGIFTISSALLGANSATGVDIDVNSIRLAGEISEKLNADNTEFVNCDVCDFNVTKPVDTIIQNPPFGSQKKSKKGADLRFVKKAIELSPDVLYSFHMASSKDFLIDYYLKNDLEISHIFSYSFPIPRIYHFHTRESKNVEVIVIRALFS